MNRFTYIFRAQDICVKKIFPYDKERTHRKTDKTAKTNKQINTKVKRKELKKIK